MARSKVNSPSSFLLFFFPQLNTTSKASTSCTSSSATDAGRPSSIHLYTVLHVPGALYPHSQEPVKSPYQHRRPDDSDHHAQSSFLPVTLSHQFEQNNRNQHTLSKTASIPAEMGCNKIGHVHEWPTSGILTIQRCEVKCNFCEGDAAEHSFKYAWFLRRHVRAMHIRRGPYKNLEVSDDWNDAQADKRKTTRQRRKKAIQTQAPQYVIQPTYAEPLAQEHKPYAIDPAAVEVQAITGFGLDDILAIDDGNYDFALGDEMPSRLMLDDMVNEDNVESWLDHLDEGAYDLPPLDSLDASAARLFDSTNAAEANEIDPGLSPLDSISNASGDVDALLDDTHIPPFLPSFDVSDPTTDTPSVDDDGPLTPVPEFAPPDFFFADATYHVNGFDFAVEDPTHGFLADSASDADGAPWADAFPSTTPVDDEKFHGMMTFLEMASQQMIQQGMDLDQMLFCVDAFRKNLREKMAQRV